MKLHYVAGEICTYNYTVYSVINNHVSAAYRGITGTYVCIYLYAFCTIKAETIIPEWSQIKAIGLLLDVVSILVIHQVKTTPFEIIGLTNDVHAW